MNEAYLKVISQVDAQGVYPSTSQLDSLAPFFAEGKLRMGVAEHIISNTSAIIAGASRELFAEQPQLIAPDGNACTNLRMAACLRDMDIILRYVTYALFAGDASVLDDYCLNGLKEVYLALGVPGRSVASAIQKMKRITLKSLTSEEDQTDLGELTISEIRKFYPKQWITIEVTKSKDGFPSEGKVLYYDHDVVKLVKKISPLSGDKIYTFFSSKIDEKPEPLIKNNVNRVVPEVKNHALLAELASYFDRVVASIE
jgi:phycocyanin beta chain